jgi:hypothetical protein
MLSPEIIKEISKIETHEDCKEAWDLIRLRLSRIVASEAQNFRVGQKVWFMSKKLGGNRIMGTVTRINKKSISVETSVMGKWNVAPSLLSPVETKNKKA